ALAEAQKRRQEARRGAGILDEELDGLLWGLPGRARIGDLAAAAVHLDRAIRRLGRIVLHLKAESQSLEAVHPRLRVLAPERAAQGHGLARKHGQDQSAIGDALGARQGNDRIGWAIWRDDLDEVGQHELASVDRRLGNRRAEAGLEEIEVAAVVGL